MRVKETLIVCLSVVLALVLVELALRVWTPSSIPITLPDTRLGVVYRPGAIRHSTNAESGVTRTVSINSFGFRDQEWHSGRPTILVVGDSFTAAMEVEEEKRYTEELERQLRASSDPSWQVLNMAISGTGPEAYLARMEKYYERFKPEVVVVSIFNGNDLHNINYNLNPAGGRMNYVYRDGEVVHYSSQASLWQQLVWKMKVLLGRSYVVQLFYDAKIKITHQASAKSQVSEEKILPGYCDSPRSDIEDSFVILKYILERMKLIAGEKLVVLQIPDKAQLRRDLPESCDATLVEEKLAERAAELGIPLVSLFPQFNDSNEGFYYAGHLNEKGHRVAAEALFHEILKLKGAVR